jgi:putative flippase GtrA
LPLAVALAFLVGMSTAFALNRKFVFAAAQSPLRVQAMWFVLVNLAALAQTLLVTLLLARWLLPWMGIVVLRESLAHAAGIVAPAVTSYLLHKRLTFNDRIWPSRPPA